MKATVSFAGLEPSTGVPRINRSKFVKAGLMPNQKWVLLLYPRWLVLAVLCFLFLKNTLHMDSLFRLCFLGLNNILYRFD